MRQCVMRSVLSLGLLACAGSARAGDVSTFDAGPDGWQLAEIDFFSASGGTNPPVVTATSPLSWLATGGNPGGYVEITADPSAMWSWFSAPGGFLGDQSGVYGGTLSFDAISTADGVGSEILPAVILVGSGVTLYADAEWPVDSWTPYSFSLTESGWYTDFFDPAGSMATQAQFMAVLGDLQAMYINGDWSTVPETEQLDNVVMIPGPGAWALACTGMLMVGRRRRVA